jgi:hypothetical protein
MVNISDVTKIDETRKQIKKEIYTKIYDQFSRKIKSAAEQGRKDVFLRTPSFVLGYPTFDKFRATKYLERQLILSGFVVQLLSDCDIYVSWHTKTKKNNEIKDVPESEEFPSLVNLKKVANKFRRNA